MYDIIEFAIKTIELLLKNPVEFSSMIVISVSCFALAYWRLHRRYKKRIANLSETVVALYDSEAVALELLKESDTGVSKQLLRKLAFNKSQMSTKVYRYKALNYLKK